MNIKKSMFKSIYFGGYFLIGLFLHTSNMASNPRLGEWLDQQRHSIRVEDKFDDGIDDAVSLITSGTASTMETASMVSNPVNLGRIKEHQNVEGAYLERKAYQQPYNNVLQVNFDDSVSMYSDSAFTIESTSSTSLGGRIREYKTLSHIPELRRLFKRGVLEITPTNMHILSRAVEFYPNLFLEYNQRLRVIGFKEGLREVLMGFEKVKDLYHFPNLI